jgi:YVTN family beta-propeller protein
MAIAFRAAQGSNNGSGGTSITMAMPAGVQDGDVLLMSITARGGTGTTITPPSGMVSGGTNPFGVLVAPDGVYAYILTAASLRVVDAATMAFVQDIAITGGAAVDLLVSADSATVYVASGTTAGAGKVSVITVASLAVTATVSVADYPLNMAMAPNGAHLYVASAATAGTNALSVIATSDNSLVTVNMPSPAYSLAVTTDGSRVWVGCSNYVTEVRTSDNAVLGSTSSFGYALSAIAVAPDGAKIYATATSDARIMCITASSRAWVYSTGASAAQNVTPRVTPDSSRVYFGSNSAAQVTWLDASTNVCTAIPTGWYPKIEMNPAGTYVYAGNPGSQNVQVIRVSDNTIVATITAGNNPTSNSREHGVAVSADGSRVWVTNWTSSDVTVIDASNNTQIGVWTLLDRQNSGTTLAQAIYRRIAASEPASYVVALTSALASGAIIALSGADRAAIRSGAFAGGANASSASVLAPSIGTWDVIDGIDVGFFGTAYGSSFTPPTSYSEPTNGESASTGTTGATTTEVAYRALSAVSTVGSITATAANAAVNTGHHVWVKGPNPPPAPIAVSLIGSGL